PGPPPRVFAFLSRAGGSELTHLRRFGSRISVLAPNWYELQQSTLTLTGGPTPQVVALARQDGIGLWPVVNAQLTSGAVLATAPARARIAAAVAAEAAVRGYAGMTLDIEQLPVAQSRAYTELVRLLAARLHAQGEQLAVYVPRRTADGGDTAYDWRHLAQAVDVLIASGYDEHAAGTRPGPVTTAAGFERMLKYADGVSLRKIAPAIGAFGYSWPIGGGEGVLLSTLAAQQQRRMAGVALRGAGGDASYRVGGHVVHYQTGIALVARARDARAAGMHWLALFSLGREPDWFWSHVRTWRQRR
ncbi:MAG: hypothetical protein WBQ18_07375, partial [Solirubrobacteraceae bacterium]